MSKQGKSPRASSPPAVSPNPNRSGAGGQAQASHGNFSPALSPLQISTSTAWLASNSPAVPDVCFVTGGTGFVGQRLVEMLVERGAKKVISFDIVPPPKEAWTHPNVQWVVGDITKAEEVQEAMKGAQCVWHNAAAVGPFHPRELYFKVNYEGTLNVINACKANGVRKCVMSSSPSTRFDGSDVDGLTEDQMPSLPQSSYLQTYAETKAMGEIAMREACCDDFMTVAVAPHQVYGPRDNLFLPNILEAGGTGRIRIFGPGTNRICFTHVDNYCHGLIIAERALYPRSPALGKFYIVTDGDTHPEQGAYLIFWRVVDEAIVGMGFASMWGKMKLPVWLLTPVAYGAEAVGKCFGTTFKLNRFNVRVLTMHRWFNISAAERDLHYKPIVAFREGWNDTISWFKANWLPNFLKTQGESNASVVGLSAKTQAKIDIQAGKGAAAQDKRA